MSKDFMRQRDNMNKKYIVRLTEQEREQLDALIRKGKAAAYKIKHANILLKADADGAAWSDEEIAGAFSVHPHTVAGMRERFVEQGLAAALNRKKQECPSQQPLFDGAAEAHLIALSCSEPPPGHARWTLRLLADKVVELQIVASTSHETVRRTLKKTC
jgi:Homeodomain-like domain